MLKTSSSGKKIPIIWLGGLIFSDVQSTTFMWDMSQKLKLSPPSVKFAWTSNSFFDQCHVTVVQDGRFAALIKKLNFIHFLTLYEYFVQQKM